MEVTMSSFVKIMPRLKNEGFTVRFVGEPKYMERYFWYTDFANKYDFKKLQVVSCDLTFRYSDDYSGFTLTLRKLPDMIGDKSRG